MLTKRETEILKLRLSGLSAQAVAQMIGRSKRTVEFHLSSIYHKVEAHSLLEAGLKLGLVTVE